MLKERYDNVLNIIFRMINDQTHDQTHFFCKYWKKKKKTGVKCEVQKDIKDYYDAGFEEYNDAGYGTTRIMVVLLLVRRGLW